MVTSSDVEVFERRSIVPLSLLAITIRTTRHSVAHLVQLNTVSKEEGFGEQLLIRGTFLDVYLTDMGCNHEMRGVRGAAHLEANSDRETLEANRD